MGEEEVAVGLEIFEKFGSAWKLRVEQSLARKATLVNL
jgi:hypothetical protein